MYNFLKTQQLRIKCQKILLNSWREIQKRKTVYYWTIEAN